MGLARVTPRLLAGPTTAHSPISPFQLHFLTTSAARVYPVQMAFGTPEEDAMRRDLTINALFYNIFTGLVEDYTGRGVADLKVKNPFVTLWGRDAMLSLNCLL